MCKQILLKIILITTILITSHRMMQAQHHLGVEAGATISSLYTTQAQQPQIGQFASPTVGGRAGLFFESDLNEFFAIKTGLFGALKGCQLQTGERWDLVYISIPALAVFTPIKPLKLGVGIDVGALVSENFPALVDSRLSLGIRGEVAWQINPSFRLIAHSTVDITPTTSFFIQTIKGI